MSQDELPALDFASALTLLGDAVSHVVLGALEDTGLRHSHGYLIQRLVAAPATATEIAADLGISQQAVSKAVKELAELGIVEVVVNPADKRSRPVQLTARGRQAVNTSRKTRLEINQRIQGALGHQAFEQTLRALTTIIDEFGLTERVRRRTVPPHTPELP